MARGDKRVYTIPPGPSFLKALAESILNGALVPGFIYDPTNPQSLADVTIYVPTRRAARVLRSEFTLLLARQSAILPVIRPLGETDDDSGFFDAALPERLDLLPPIGPIPAALELARLIEAWRNSLPKAIVDLHGGAPVIAPASAADAVWLAKELSNLIGEVETAEADWEKLDTLVAEDYAGWWQLTLAFLKIARIFWPARLEELYASSPSRHRNAVLTAEATRMALDSHKGPVIVAGSTGSLPATARLISTVASLDQGAVVLPGLDLAMPDDHWDCLQIDPLKSPDPTIFGHPQFGLAQLLSILKLKRDDVVEIAAATGNIGNRSKVLSLAFAPSEKTDQWQKLKADINETDLASALADISLIEAPNERVEATAIAIALKLALENARLPDSQVALITPDRGLAQRVVAELMRFGIEADDSAGTPLAATSHGSFLRLLLEATLFPGDPVAIMSLLKHPLMRLGLPKADVEKAARLLEIHALRGGTGAVDISALGPLFSTQSAAQSEARHEPAWRAPLDEAAVELTLELTRRISAAVEPLVAPLAGEKADPNFSGTLKTADWAERTGRALEALAIDENGNLTKLWNSEGGEVLASLLAGVMEAEEGLEVTGPEWAGVVEALGSGSSVKPKSMNHPRVFIWGTQEARLQHVETIIIGGLNEGQWPQQPGTNPFLSRSMKIAFGLEPPERRTGQIAHDFQMASAAPHVIYSRALRADNAPSVASRFLQRLLAIAGPQIATQMRERGALYCSYAGLVDDGERQKPAERPEPKPDSSLIPTRYSFSEAGRLRRDPYSVYARRILRLDPIDPFNTDPGVAERGTLYHAILDQFVREDHQPDGPDAWEAMTKIMDQAFLEADLPPHIVATWRPRFEETARAYLAWDAARTHEIKKSSTEARARMALPNGFELTGLADRIDVKTSGLADIIDYKTGSTPSLRQARTLLDPQLALEAAALEAGAFNDLNPQEVDDLIYVRLRPGNKFDTDTVNGDPANARTKTPLKSAHDLAEDAIRELVKLLTLLQTGKRGFLSRVIPERAEMDGDYDHLARTAEWSTADASDEGGSDG